MGCFSLKVNSCLKPSRTTIGVSSELDGDTEIRSSLLLAKDAPTRQVKARSLNMVRVAESANGGYRRLDRYRNSVNQECFVDDKRQEVCLDCHAQLSIACNWRSFGLLGIVLTKFLVVI
eukprot:m.226573 g.226573  ORF g.226573 m.226573 type:complete len:119 (-) comp17312_c0_seq1:70-426(-)